LRELFGNSIGLRLLDEFEEGMDLREEADYSITYSEESAHELIRNARRFITEAKRILKIEA